MKKLNGKNYSDIMQYLWDVCDFLSDDLAEELARSVMSPKETQKLLEASKRIIVLDVRMRKEIARLYGDESYVEEEE